MWKVLYRSSGRVLPPLATRALPELVFSFFISQKLFSHFSFNEAPAPCRSAFPELAFSTSPLLHFLKKHFQLSTFNFPLMKFSTVCASLRLGDASQRFGDASQRLRDASQRLGDASQRLGDVSQRLRDASQRFGDASQRLRERPSGKGRVLPPLATRALPELVFPELVFSASQHFQLSTFH
jgi:hypothetical protein